MAVRWRLLIDGAGDGPVNMAVDEALLETALAAADTADGTTVVPEVTVRFYGFSRPTITFGYAQRIEDAVDSAACLDRGVEVVRRVTGGRALLHGDDLTYSVTGAAKGVFADRSVKEVYRLAAAPFRAALEALEVPLDSAPPVSASEARTDATLPCLFVATGHEITTGGRKLVPSAQRWRKRAFLQHGSLLLRIREPLLRATTPLPEGPLPAVGLEELRGPGLEECELVHVLTRAYEGLFGEPPSSRELTEQERQRVRELTVKYASIEWNVGGRRPSMAP